MQPIIMFAIVGIAATGLGMGFLAPGFTLNVQQLGAQETLLESPINTANVDFTIDKVETEVTEGGTHTAYLNVISRCSFHSPTSLGATSVIICKLTDKDHDIVAEGKLTLTRTYTGSTSTYITIEQTAFDGANDVQNIEDVKIVILGPKPAGFP
jgi:hypothetical protein